ncbi:asparagine synthase (glutamine-hydrolyzing) [Hydrogenobaculum sp.]
MCGILGLFGNPKSVDINLFKKALDKIAHRGPDAHGVYQNEDIIFGHRRLSIIDLSPLGNQPMVDEETNNVIIFNGEIYNYKSIRDFLTSKGIRFNSSSDTEVLLKAYRYFGVEVLSKLRGMFSFCIYDADKKSLFFARDRFGKKPFYYAFIKENFLFSSEIKALLPFFDKKPLPDKNGVADYFRYLAPSYGKTIYEGIYKLPPSCFGILDKNGLLIKEYYNPLEYASKSHQNEGQVLKDIEDKLIESVELRLVGDVEVASLLSGGLDSSFVSALYSKIAKDKFNRNINTFSIGYDEYEHYSELSWALKVSNFIGSNHHPITISSKDFIDKIDEVVYFLDEPINDPATLPTYVISSYIKENGIKVALSGEGSDELFFGYDMYYKYLAYDELSKSLKKESKELLLESINFQENMSKYQEFLRRALKDEVVFRTIGECFTELELKKFLRFSYENNQIELFSKRFEPFKHHHQSLWYYFVDMYMWIGEVLMMKVDKMAMAHSVELRAPMLDHELHQLVLNVDPTLRISNQNKHLLKKIAIKYLPEEIVYRRKKGFSYPFIEWFYKEKKDFLKDWLNVNKEHGFFDEVFLRFLYENGNSKAYKHHVWAVEIFNRWFKQNYLSN